MKDELDMKRRGEGGWRLKRGWVRVSVGLAMLAWFEFLGAFLLACYQGRQVGAMLVLVGGWPIFYVISWGMIYMTAYSSRQGVEFRAGFGYMRKFFGVRIWEILLKSQPIMAHVLLIAVPILISLMAGVVLWAVFSDYG
ncbi:MAG: hypothetical protein AMJ79_07485 [Phycisphaerae bacterium SM23_30]|nr:MAG: hypothetical protein AMJ79_07485 [Phycisphaerae bacterium SM23_30]